MQVNNLLLSLAIPAAAKTIGVASQAISNAGQSFVEALNNKQTTTESVESSPLQDFAERLRDFLSSHGVDDAFKLRLRVDPAGTDEAAVSGENAERVAQLLRENPDLLPELRQIAHHLQANRASPSSGLAPHLNVQITPGGSSHWTLG